MDMTNRNGPAQGLDRDFVLEDRSMYMRGGTRAGVKTYFVAEKRLVIRADWGNNVDGMVHPDVDQWEIPGEITTADALRLYITQHPPVRQERHDLERDFDLEHESIHVAGGGHVGSEVRFFAADRKVVSRKWGVTSFGEQDPDEKIWHIPDHITTEAQLRQYIRVTRPVCPGKPVVNELDKDCILDGIHQYIVWENPETGEQEHGGIDTMTRYVAATRTVIFREKGFTDKGPIDSGEMRWILPPDIATKEEALFYIHTHPAIGEEDSGNTEPPVAPPEKDELDRDIVLNIKSISAVKGHAGAKTEYIAKSRVVSYSRWSTTVRGFWIFKKTRHNRPPAETLPIPAEIRTEKALREYVKKHKPLWL